MDNLRDNTKTTWCTVYPDRGCSEVNCCLDKSEIDKYPSGKLNENDEGALYIRIFNQDKNLIIDFGKQIAWIGINKQHALELANIIIKEANLIND